MSFPKVSDSSPFPEQNLSRAENRPKKVSKEGSASIDSMRDTASTKPSRWVDSRQFRASKNTKATDDSAFSDAPEDIKKAGDALKMSRSERGSVSLQVGFSSKETPLEGKRIVFLPRDISWIRRIGSIFRCFKQEEVVIEVSPQNARMARIQNLHSDIEYLEDFNKKTPNAEIGEILSDLKARVAAIEDELDEENLNDVEAAGPSAADVIDQQIAEIEALLVPIKTNYIGFEILGQGAVKNVWSRMADREFAYITPKQGLGERLKGMNTAEIREEIASAKQMKKDIEKSNLRKFLSENHDYTTAGLLTEELLGKYHSLNALLDVLTDPETTAGQLTQGTEVSENDALEILSLFQYQDDEDILDQINELRLSGNSLALDFEIVEEPSFLGRLVVRTPRAKMDLEDFIRGRIVPYPESGLLGMQFLAGVGALHRINRVHGDIKPENILVFKGPDNRLQVRIMDFGKTRTLMPDQSKNYWGNPRFAPPEGRLSQAGEVYTSALVLMRILEEGFPDEPLETDFSAATTEEELNWSESGLSEDGLKVDSGSSLEKQETVVKESPTPSKAPVHKKIRRGIEKTLVDSPLCPQKENKTLFGKFKVLIYRLKRTVYNQSPEKLEPSRAVVNAHIEQLIDKLISFHPDIPEEKFEELEELLKDMTEVDPKDRPPMDEVIERYKKILGGADFMTAEDSSLSEDVQAKSSNSSQESLDEFP